MRKKHKTRPMKGELSWVKHPTESKWKLRVVLHIFGTNNEVFLSNQWYSRKRDCYNNYRLIFFGEWIEE